MRIRLVVISAVLLASCTNSGDKNNTGDSTNIAKLPADSGDVTIEELNKEDYYIWKVNSEEKTMSRNPKLEDAYLGVDTLIMGLNEMYPKIRLEKVRHSNDTLYTRIRESAYLTDQMGSAGSEAYIAQTVLNLSAAKGVKFVNIDFEMGSHATPDTWSRESFQDYKIIE